MLPSRVFGLLHAKGPSVSLGFGCLTPSGLPKPSVPDPARCGTNILMSRPDVALSNSVALSSDRRIVVDDGRLDNQNRLSRDINTGCTSRDLTATVSYSADLPKLAAVKISSPRHLPHLDGRLSERKGTIVVLAQAKAFPNAFFVDLWQW
jgi:hypothetical protein